MDKEVKLTPRQMRFCEYYSKTLNGRQSAIKAGFSEKTAHVQSSVLLKNPKIMEYINELSLKYDQSEGFGKDTAVQWLVDIARPTSREATSSRLKAMEQLAKLHGWNIDVKQINSNVTHKYSDLENLADTMTPEEIEQLIKDMGDNEETVN